MQIFLAIAESGNIIGNSFVAWLLVKNAMLCLVTKKLQRASVLSETQTTASVIGLELSLIVMKMLCTASICVRGPEQH